MAELIMIVGYLAIGLGFALVVDEFLAHHELDQRLMGYPGAFLMFAVVVLWAPLIVAGALILAFERGR